MTTPRIFYPAALGQSMLITLDEANSRHLLKVLRLRCGEPLQVFNGLGGAYAATLQACQQHRAIVKVGEWLETITESPLKIHLGQAISRGERMDYAVQKSVELGVNSITPLITERCGVQLNAERVINRLQHWQKVAISASEQSGRCLVPPIQQPCQLVEFLNLNRSADSLRLICQPFAPAKSRPDLDGISQVTLIIGPEGGFSENEIAQAERAGFQPLSLGPRILRTETAAVVAMTALQTLGGDLY